MTNSQALKLFNQTWQTIFNLPSPFTSLDQIKNQLATHIPLPTPVITIDHTTAYTTPTYFHTPSIFVDFATLNPTTPQSPPSILPSPDSLIQHWLKNYHYVVNKNINSVHVTASDNVYKSRQVYNSCYIFNSQDILFCRQIGSSQKLIASYNNDTCTNSIRLSDSLNCSYCFNVSWSNKVSRCLFVHNGYNLFECLFCFNLYSKKYCIANIQFTPEQYYTLKNQILQKLATNNWQLLLKLL